MFVASCERNLSKLQLNKNTIMLKCIFQLQIHVGTDFLHIIQPKQHFITDQTQKQINNVILTFFVLKNIAIFCKNILSILKCNEIAVI